MHVLRACYQTCIWKHSLLAQRDVQPPIGYGWKLEDNQIIINWGYDKAAPDEILEFMACRCKKSICCCVSNHLPCTDMCKCRTCDNRNDELVYGESVELEDIDLYEDEF